MAIETTTLAMAPLIYFNHNARSIEATWKYMLICSVGIALALLGLYFLAYSTMVAGQEATLLLGPLIAAAAKLSPAWLNAAFIFLLVGFGTKMGLAPLHTWKPDAYGEAPGLVGALLAGGLVNCAFLAIMRIYQICMAAGHPAFFQRCNDRDGAGLHGICRCFRGAPGRFQTDACLFQRRTRRDPRHRPRPGQRSPVRGTASMINNALTKGVLFLSSGNIHRSYNSKSCDSRARGAAPSAMVERAFSRRLLRHHRVPPFAPFISEFTIISTAFVEGHYLSEPLFSCFWP